MSDPSSNHIISWSAEGRTFTVWQPDLLEVEHLPNTFKHSNFASFVRQLNNYGFRKCHSDRYEFGVEGFEQAKPELLTTLRRHDAPRSKKSSGNEGVDDKDGYGQHAKAAAMSGKSGKSGGLRYGKKKEGTPADGTQSLELGAYGGITSEVEQLKRDRLLLLKEVMRLREVQSTTSEEVRHLAARLQTTEQFQQQMMSFVEAVQQGTGGLNFNSFSAAAAGMGMGSFTSDEVMARTSRAGFPRKRRQMFLSSAPPGDGVELRVGSEPSFGAAAFGNLGSGGDTGFGGGGPGGSGGALGSLTTGGGGGGGGSALKGGALSLQEIDELMPSAPGVGASRPTDDDDALLRQAYGPLSPNPHVPIQLPFGAGDNEKDFPWMDLLIVPNQMQGGGGSSAPGERQQPLQQHHQQQSVLHNIFGGGGAGGGQQLQHLPSAWNQPPSPAPAQSTPLIRSISEDDPPAPQTSSDPARSTKRIADANADANANVVPVLDSSAVSAPPGANSDTFVSSILERGPSLEKQLSLGFLDSMDSADIGEMVRDMQIGGANQQQSDEFARRVDALTNQAE